MHENTESADRVHIDAVLNSLTRCETARNGGDPDKIASEENHLLYLYLKKVNENAQRKEHNEKERRQCAFVPISDKG